MLRQEYKNLTPINKDLVTAFLAPKLKEYNTEFLKNIVDLLILETHQNCGFLLDEGNIEDTINDFVEEIQKYVGTITFEELRIYFKNGWKFKYGKYTGLNNATYWKWLNSAIFDNERLQLRRMVFGQQKKEDNLLLTEEEKEKIVVEEIIKQFKSYCKGDRSFMATTVVTYDYLKKIGAIEFDEEEQGRIREIVKKELKDDAILNKGAKRIEDVLKNISKEQLINGCKRKALGRYFERLNQMGDDIEIIINDCKKDKEDGK